MVLEDDIKDDTGVKSSSDASCLCGLEEAA